MFRCVGVFLEVLVVVLNVLRCLGVGIGCVGGVFWMCWVCFQCYYDMFVCVEMSWGVFLMC